MTLPSPVLLYDQPRAPNPRRLNIFLSEKGIDFERRILDLIAGDHKTPEYLAKAGAAQVPALELSDGTVLTETQAICRYVEALYPEPNLLGRDALERSLVEMWQRRVEFGLFLNVGMTFRHTNPKMGVLEDQCQQWGETNRLRIGAALEALNRRLADRDWIALDRITVADITAIVAIDFLRIIRYPVPESLSDLNIWIARMRSRPSCDF